MKLTKNHKIIIGVLGLGVLAYATKKYWMPKKKETKIAGVNTQSTPTSSSTTNTNATTSSNSSKRNSIIAELNKTSSAKQGLTIDFTPDFFKKFTDDELETFLKIAKSKVLEANTEKEANDIMNKNGIKKEQFANIMNKFQNAFTPTKK